MKYIILMIIALFGASIHAPELKKSKKGIHPAHDAMGVSNPLIKLTKGDGLVNEIKHLKDTIEKKEQVKKRYRGWMWIGLSIVLCIVNPFALIYLGYFIKIVSIIISRAPNHTLTNFLSLLPPAVIVAVPFTVYAAFTLFTLYAFIKGCVLVTERYRRRRKYKTIALYGDNHNS